MSKNKNKNKEAAKSLLSKNDQPGRDPGHDVNEVKKEKTLDFEDEEDLDEKEEAKKQFENIPLVNDGAVLVLDKEVEKQRNLNQKLATSENEEEDNSSIESEKHNTRAEDLTAEKKAAAYPVTEKPKIFVSETWQLASAALSEARLKDLLIKETIIITEDQDVHIHLDGLFAGEKEKLELVKWPAKVLWIVPGVNALRPWRDDKNLLENPELAEPIAKLRKVFTDDRIRELWNDNQISIIGIDENPDFVISFTKLTEEEMANCKEMIDTDNRAEAKKVIVSVLGEKRATELLSNGIEIDETGNVKVDRSLLYTEELRDLSSEHVVFPAKFESFASQITTLGSRVDKMFNDHNARIESAHTPNNRMPGDDEQPEKENEAAKVAPANYRTIRRG